MKSLKYLMLATVMFTMSGCEALDEIFGFDTAKIQKEKLQSKINKVVFQDENAAKKAIITSNCEYNEPVSYTYYETPSEAHSNYFSDTRELISVPWSGKALKPFWDLRYVNSVERYVNSSLNKLEYANLAAATGLDARSGIKNIIVGSVMAQLEPFGSAVESKCVGNTLAAGATVNLNDAPEQYIEYAGPQATFMYRLADRSVTMPWGKKDGNLMIQAYFNNPIYRNFEKNMGASVNFGVYLKNKKSGQMINFIIGAFSSGDSWIKEQTELKYDPTTEIVHVATVASEKARWSTISPRSQSITKIYSSQDGVAEEDWNAFFRVNISYDNLKTVLQELKNSPPAEANGEEFGVNPQDWQVTSIYIQYEVEEEGGKALLSGSFKGFEAYSSKLPL